MTTIIDNEPVRKDSNRHIEFAWELQDLGEGVTEQLVLSAGHDSDRKCFYATLNQQAVEQTPTSFVVGFALFGGITLCREPVARFSQKRLDAFATEALAVLRSSTPSDRMTELLTPSDRSCGCTGRYHATGCEVYAASVRR